MKLNVCKLLIVCLTLLTSQVWAADLSKASATTGKTGVVQNLCLQTGPSCSVINYKCPVGTTFSCQNDSCGVGKVTCTGKALELTNAANEPKIKDGIGIAVAIKEEAGYSCKGGALCTTGEFAVCLAPNAPNYAALYAQHCGSAKVTCASIKIGGDCYCRDTLKGPEVSCYSCNNLCLMKNSPTVSNIDSINIQEIDWSKLEAISATKNCVGSSYCDNLQCYTPNHPLSVNNCSIKKVFTATAAATYKDVDVQNISIAAVDGIAMNYKALVNDVSITAPVTAKAALTDAVALSNSTIAAVMKDDVADLNYVSEVKGGGSCVSNSWCSGGTNGVCYSPDAPLSIQNCAKKTPVISCNGGSYCDDKVCYIPSHALSLKYCGAGPGVSACLNGKVEYAAIEKAVCQKKVTACDGVQVPSGCSCKNITSSGGVSKGVVSCDWKVAAKICREEWSKGNATDGRGKYGVPSMVESDGTFQYTTLEICPKGRVGQKTRDALAKTYRQDLPKEEGENGEKGAKLAGLKIGSFYLNAVTGGPSVGTAKKSHALKCNFINPISCSNGLVFAGCAEKDGAATVTCTRGTLSSELKYSFEEGVKETLVKNFSKNLMLDAQISNLNLNNATISNGTGVLGAPASNNNAPAQMQNNNLSN